MLKFTFLIISGFERVKGFRNLPIKKGIIILLKDKQEILKVDKL